MSTFPGSPRTLKGALVAGGGGVGAGSAVVFQYNPDTVTRTLTPQTAGGNNPGEALRLKGPPQEVIKLDGELDAADQLGAGDPLAGRLGLHPALAALELLVYPRAALVVANAALAAAGVIEILPPAAPPTLLVWGTKRVLPVRVTEFSITEEAFDPALNPIRAKVSLGLRVLNYQDLGLLSPGGALFLAHQVAKEAMALLAVRPAP
jgi:hypothetical protein